MANCYENGLFEKKGRIRLEMIADIVRICRRCRKGKLKEEFKRMIGPKNDIEFFSTVCNHCWKEFPKESSKILRKIYKRRKVSANTVWISGEERKGYKIPLQEKCHYCGNSFITPNRQRIWCSQRCKSKLEEIRKKILRLKTSK